MGGEWCWDRWVWFIYFGWGVVQLFGWDEVGLCIISWY